ncbi:MAG: DUF1801 domain-containing protein [Anaerolineales bacterium]
MPAKKTANKTVPTTDSVQAYMDSIEPEQKREDALAILALMQDATKLEPVMWGKIVGFGKYHYKYASGREGDSVLTGFAARKAALTLYIMAGFDEYDELKQKLGKFEAGAGCLYIKRLSDVHVPTLKKLIQKSVRHMEKTHPAE